MGTAQYKSVAHVEPGVEQNPCSCTVTMGAQTDGPTPPSAGALPGLTGAQMSEPVQSYELSHGWFMLEFPAKTRSQVSVIIFNCAKSTFALPPP